ncbi:MAG: division/cell wall cluster transcriptional repressor MraZ [Candidatus Zambryskibacteria bacterium]|nr:division/cell wall cluster transcriptional repressor MraZ [Candidatus Zambryskibacteria bacterium]
MYLCGIKWYDQKTMFIGEHTHTVDEKNRFSLPAKFRKDLGKKVVVTRGKDRCLVLYPHKTWLEISSEVKQKGHVESDQKYARFTFSGASEIEIDSIGRILIPEFLRDFAELKNTIVLTGVHDKVEIWNDKKWATYRRKLESEFA